MMRSRGGERDDLEKSLGMGSVIKESSLGLSRVLIVMIIFVIGVVIGLTASTHVNRYFNSQADQFYINPAPAPTPTTTVDKNCTTVLSVVQSCEKVDCLSMDNFINPKSLVHGMSDEELFWRASMVPKKSEYPFTRVPRVAFMFLTRGPLPMLPLWERFFHGHDKLFSIYVHAVPGYELNVSSASPFFQREIPSRNVEWGTVSLADAERRLLANALLDFSNERFVLLSESCIPIYDFPTVYKYLTRSVHSFVDSFDDPSRYGRGRYSRRMKPDIKLADWRKGSQWFEMSRALAVVIVSDTKYYSLFSRYCTPACYPDEHYIPTYLHMFYGSMNSNRSVTWVDWSMGGPHPATYEQGNITETFIQSLRNNGTLCSYNSEETPVCYLFARKFAPNTLEPLLNLSSTVMKF